MTPDTSFDTFQTTVNADPSQLAKARERRDTVLDAMKSHDDVDGTDSFVSGSLARGTQRGQINDVDLVIVYKADEHPDWGEPGDSAEDALEHARGQVKDALGTNGELGEEIRHTLIRNHAIKCFLDDPDDPEAFTVDIVPALRKGSGRLLIPEQLSSRWIESDPQYLINEVARRHEEWNEFAKLVRLLKHWNDHSDSEMKSLTIEVLALKHLPATESRQKSIQRFFTAAEANILHGVSDPASVCGDIQPDLDLASTRRVLASAATVAWDAYTFGVDGEDVAAVCKWRELFGPDFPEPPDGCDDSGGSGVVGFVPPRRVRDTPQG